MDDVILKLMQLGFSSYEAKAYCALLKKHPAIGYEVSKISKIPTAKIYETLNHLKSKGAVISSSTEPVFYDPVDPQVLLTRIENEFTAKIDHLSGQLKKIDPIPDIDLTWNLTGYQSVIEKIKAAIEHATKELMLSIWPKEAALLKEQLAQAEQRGVRVVAGIFGEFDMGCARTINLDSCGVSSEKRLGKRLSVVVSDSKEVVISEMAGNEDSTGIWATSQCMTLIAKEYIKHDIWGKVLIDTLGSEQFDLLCKSSELLSYLIQNR